MRAAIQSACYGGIGVHNVEIANAYRGALKCAERALEECGDACKVALQIAVDQARRNAEATGAAMLIGTSLFLVVLFGS